MGQILTFYSYKGGVGRSMALANIAILLAMKGKKVLIVDWDLEAPGLEYYFKDYFDSQLASNVPGIINLLHSFGNDDHDDRKINWRDCVIKFTVRDSDLNIITSGEKDNHYFSLVRALDVDNFYEKMQGGNFIESLRNEWKIEYDFILIDSRTGITDLGGVCTIQLPDVLVLLFNSNEQNLMGIVEVANKASLERKKLPFDRFSLLIYPIASRFDAQAEFKISQEWLDRFASELKDCFSNWLPKSIDVRDFIEATKIPYTPYFSFGEKLPVIEHGVSDPTSLGFAYETIASIVAGSFENIENVLGSRSLVEHQNSEKRVNITESIPKRDPRLKPRRKSAEKLSERGLLSLVMLFASVGALGVALSAGSSLVLDILGTGLENSLPTLPAKAFVIGLAYGVGWLTAIIAIRVYGNLILSFIINYLIWGCLIGVCALYILILQRLYDQQYNLLRFFAYLLMMTAGLGTMVGLHLIIEDHDLRPFSIPLLIINMINLGGIVYRYVFTTANPSYLWTDLFFFIFISVFAFLMLAHIGLLNPTREKISSYFNQIQLDQQRQPSRRKKKSHKVYSRKY